MFKSKYYMGIRCILFVVLVLLVAIVNYIKTGLGIFNVSAFIFGSIGLIISLFTYFVPYVVYDDKGYVQFPFYSKIKKEKCYTWDDVQEVFSIWASHWTQVVTKDGNTWLVSSLGKNNYYETLRDLLKYIPEEKFDKLTLKRAKSNKRFYVF